MLFLILFISYLIGSIPFGFLLTKIFLGKDIREIGSGNIGATNALRTGNKLIGYSTLILDIGKAVILLLIIKFNFSEYLFGSYFYNCLVCCVCHVKVFLPCIDGSFITCSFIKLFFYR